MGFFDRWKRPGDAAAATGSTPDAPALVPVRLDRLCAYLRMMLDEPLDAPVPDLCRARLADALRGASVTPLHPDRFDQLAAALDADAWTRLDLVTLALRRGALGDSFAGCAVGLGAEHVTAQGFIAFAHGSRLLTPDLLRESRLRVEELVRRWLSHLALPIRGENDATSRDALEQLDYARLLAQVDDARLSAEERLEYLKGLQEAEESRRPRRGKW